MVGRPSDYSPEMALEICSRIADGESLRAICKADDMPNKKTVLRWLGHHEEFSAQYARAREDQADSLAEECLDIADNASNDWMERNDPNNPGWVANGEHTQRSRLRLDARKWFASKVAPKKYGEKLDLSHSGTIETRSDADIKARIASLLAKNGPDEGGEPGANPVT